MPALPSGRYVFLTGQARITYGGLTRSLFLRGRDFYRLAGTRSTILTCDSHPEYDAERRAFAEAGLLTEGVSLVNAYEHLREVPLSPRPGAALPPELEVQGPGSLERDAAGRPWRVRHGSVERPVHDYLRRDGSPYLRMAGPATHEWKRPGAVALLTPEGHVAAAYGHPRELIARCLRDLAGDERLFVVADAHDPDLHLVLTGPGVVNIAFLHTPHTNYPRTWNAPLIDVVKALEPRLSEVDGVAVLTHRQRADFARRFGDHPRFGAIPHPVFAPEVEPGTSPRRRRGVVVARLDRQKRLDDALRAWRLVVDAIGPVPLDVYGDGPDRGALEQLRAELGLEEVVAFHGHDPRAAGAFASAQVFVMTSRHEGMAQTLLQALAHGCPVVAYDVRYGPAEVVADGVTGFLVSDGDVAGVADAVLRLLRDERLVERMSEASLQRRAAFSPEQWLEDWAALLEASSADSSEQRARLDKVRFAADHLALGPVTRLRGRLVLTGSGPTPRDPGATVALRWVGRGTDEVLDVEVATGVPLGETAIELDLDAARLAGAFTPAVRALDAFLVVTRGRDRREVRLGVPPQLRPGPEVFLTEHNNLSVFRGHGASGPAAGGTPTA